MTQVDLTGFESPSPVYEEFATIVLKTGRDFNGNPDISEWNAFTISHAIDNLNDRVERLQSDLVKERVRIADCASDIRDLFQREVITREVAEELLEDLDKRIETEYTFEVTITVTGTVLAEDENDVEGLVENSLNISVGSDGSLDDVDWEWGEVEYEQTS